MGLSAQSLTAQQVPRHQLSGRLLQFTSPSTS
jgi:hypothetical protein